MFDTITGIGGIGIKVNVTISCKSCECYQEYGLNPIELNCVEFSQVPITVRLNNDGWHYDAFSDSWTCESCENRKYSDGE